jgi:hypothetical protein
VIRGPVGRLVALVRQARERLAHERRRRQAARADRAAPRIPLSVERRQLFIAKDRHR